jgi:hypothetical protein
MKSMDYHHQILKVIVKTVLKWVIKKRKRVRIPEAKKEGFLSQWLFLKDENN